MLLQNRVTFLGESIVWCNKFFKCFFMGLAIIVAVLVNMLPKEQMVYLVNVTRFFEIMIPILAVGALFKYLCCAPSSCETK